MASRSDLPRINQCRWNGKPEKAARAKRRLKPNMPRKLESVSIHPIYSIFLQYLSKVPFYSIYLQYLSKVICLQYQSAVSIYSTYLQDLSTVTVFIYIQYLSTVFIDRSIYISYPILSYLSYLSIYPIYLSLSISVYSLLFCLPFPAPCPLSFLPFLSQGWHSHATVPKSKPSCLTCTRTQGTYRNSFLFHVPVVSLWFYCCCLRFLDFSCVASSKHWLARSHS